MIHDRDSIFSQQLDRSVKELVVTVLRTPVRAPKANATCEKIWRQPTPRVSGFPDPVQRTPSQEGSPRVGKPLQPRPTALLLRAWITRTYPGQSSGQRPQTQAANRFPYCEEICAGWLASPIPPGEGGCIKTTLVFADHRCRSHCRGLYQTPIAA